MIQRATIAHWLGGVFLAYASLSCVRSTFGPWTVHLVGLAIAYALGVGLPRFQSKVWLGYTCLLCFAFGLTILGVWLNAFEAPGLFGNLNFLGIAFAIGLIGALAYNLWWFLPIGIVGLWYSQSRGAILATGLIFLASLWPRYRVTVFTCLGLGLTVAMAKEDIHLSIFTRLGIWQDTVEHLTVFGNGWGSYLDAYTSWPVHRNMTLLIAQHAYNDYLELVFTLGIGSIPLFLLIILATDRQSTARPIIACFIILGLTYFPFWIPVVGQLFAFALGSAIKETAYGPLAPNGLALSTNHG